MISVIVLAAGESRRMGRPKLTLPWGQTTILGQVVATLAAAGVDDIVVITGAARQETETLVANLAGEFPLRPVHNPDYAKDEMIRSLQVGLTALKPETRAALIALGDQPQVEERTVRRIIATYLEIGAPLVVPSFQMRRGHPWLVARPLWPELLALPPSTTPRDFLKAHAADILYLPVENDNILRDLDTLEDYERERPHPTPPAG